MARERVPEREAVLGLDLGRHPAHAEFGHAVDHVDEAEVEHVAADREVAHVDDDEFAEFVPVPAALTAATLNTYEVPLVSPVTVAEVDVLVPSLKVVHEEPLFDEY